MSSNDAKDGTAAPVDNPYGQMCWLEIPVADAARAAKFYTAVLGWECAETSMPSPTPWVKTVHFFNKGELHGGFLLMKEGNQIVNYDKERPERMPLLPTFCVRSIEETLGEVKSFGGKLHV
ncbi:glyoxalase bleomycin resistance protein dioxygenase [Colletotrichum truncatum]|uniref:Glyoxalase bleomycin resistance protein dioxygenase n=1 Tax=Colletotrichum truncatum TaxID=5467 RepID=A0ACC3ZE66_COLTU|nr:glyoxalase bleomycin resistance protein dioxygenase [Colletotrichum truncatum]KAF6801326.1 glyoxalase bleomycin resistance protein dioxygenase [Colletotrichum truncatum]